jgi:hypothetical protein
MKNLILFIISGLAAAFIAAYTCYRIWGPMVIAIPALFLSVLAFLWGVFLSEPREAFGRYLKRGALIAIIMTVIGSIIPTIAPGPVSYGKAKWQSVNEWFQKAADQESAPKPVSYASLSAPPIPTSPPTAVPTVTPTVSPTPTPPPSEGEHIVISLEP